MHHNDCKIILILDNVRSVYNVASIFRTADCMGIDELHLCGITPQPIDRFGRSRNDFAKVSLGSEKTLQWRHWITTADAVEFARSRGCVIGALEQSEAAVSLHAYTSSSPAYAVVVGNEVSGVESQIVNSADIVWEIQQFGEKESLNVCIASAIAVYHLRFIGGGCTI